MDLDLRKLRYFVAVAERENFGRAAGALHIAQPVLSRQIRALENDLKVSLFDRDTRGTRLTAAGEALLQDARRLLPAAEAASRRVRDAAAGVRRFTIGFTPGVPIAAAVRELSRRHTDVSVEVARMDFDHRADIIRDGQVDIGHLRLPADTRGLSVEPLFSEPRVAMLPAGHRLAGKGTADITDLAAERVLRHDGVAEWDDIFAGLPDRQPQRPLPTMRTIEETLEHVAAGRGIVVLPLSAARYYARPDIIHIPVSGIAPAYVYLAWEPSRHSVLLTEYVSIVCRMARQDS
jgi:DNA-binding transcriptional LysR family regulator